MADFTAGRIATSATMWTRVSSRNARTWWPKRPCPMCCWDHVAPLQFAFYTGKQFPESYRGGAFVAEHGSWNRSLRSGYQVAFVAFKDGQPSADPVPFMTGLVPDPSSGTVYGRPVGVAVAPDGSLLVSDDGAAVIYRISVDH